MSAYLNPHMVPHAEDLGEMQDLLSTQKGKGAKGLSMPGEKKAARSVGKTQAASDSASEEESQDEAETETAVGECACNFAVC